MIRRKVAFSPEARDDLLAIYDWLADAASADAAFCYITRVQKFAMQLDVGAERGTERSDIRPDLRVIGFERRLSLAFKVEQDRVVILRILRGGRDWQALLRE